MLGGFSISFLRSVNSWRQFRVTWIMEIRGAAREPSGSEIYIREARDLTL